MLAWQLAAFEEYNNKVLRQFHYNQNTSLQLCKLCKVFTLSLLRIKQQKFPTKPTQWKLHIYICTYKYVCMCVEYISVSVEFHLNYMDKFSLSSAFSKIQIKSFAQICPASRLKEFSNCVCWHIFWRKLTKNVLENLWKFLKIH